MGKNKDLIYILTLIVIGMFIPFFGSITISYGLDLIKTGLTFAIFLLIFGTELLLVYLYFAVSSWWANKNMDKYKP